ncbi:hypothetical protein CDL15_Pgr013810 [Punica granatum]|uniref:Uncharacterized protein n=1 Tax=Punica granatum TaxID=22663 RepID=A0A218W224_PUNGR|nr:hypothetical protein CDL15_Pgr013810 [Punica granatum]
MELQGLDNKKKHSLRSKQKADLGSVLRKSWYHLRLSVRHPSRVPTWDAIVLTAASPEQAQLYNGQLSRAKRLGRVSPSTVTLAVPDPHGQLIGSVAASVNAIYALALILLCARSLSIERTRGLPKPLRQNMWGAAHLAPSLTCLCLFYCPGMIALSWLYQHSLPSSQTNAACNSQALLFLSLTSI